MVPKIAATLPLCTDTLIRWIKWRWTFLTRDVVYQLSNSFNDLQTLLAEGTQRFDTDWDEMKIGD